MNVYQRKRPGFWQKPEVKQVFRRFLAGKLSREETIRTLGLGPKERKEETIDYYAPIFARQVGIRLTRERKERLGIGRRSRLRKAGEAKIDHVMIGEGGRLVIPAPYRQALGVGEGDMVSLRLEDGELRILTPRQALRRAQVLVRRYVPAARSLADELIAERQQEARRD